MPNKRKNIKSFGKIPWWAFFIFGLLAFYFLKYYLPHIQVNHPFLQSLSKITIRHSNLISFILLLPAGKALLVSLRKINILNRQRSLDTLKKLTWRQFEELVAEAYRQMGFSVVENQDVGPDGGVDVLIKKYGEIYIVQCKHWRSVRVGVKVIREMYGIMAAESADGVIVVASGKFTGEAKAFSFDKPITLIDGEGLLYLIKRAKGGNLNKEGLVGNAEKIVDVPICDNCGEALVLRMATRGENKGKEFWGCKNYPKCHFIKPCCGSPTLQGR